MKKIIYLNIILFLIFVFTPEISGDSEEDKKKEIKLPEIGSLYKYQRADWYVRGVGDKAFEYKATGESLCIITIGISGSIVKVPEKGDVIKVDPKVPMIYINKKEDKGLRSNSYFMKKAKNRIFILLEYIRK
ncbi:MAG: hypothetical protein ABFR75_12190 [Acidobacteriota bacterium]